MAGKQPSVDAIHTKKRAATPIFVPKLPSKKRKGGGTVRRTISPKNAPSPRCVSQPPSLSALENRIHRVAPTVKGVEESARVMCIARGTVALPTETVYMMCQSVSIHDRGSGNERFTKSLSQVESSASRSVLVLESAKQLSTMLKFPQSPYAIRLANGKATPPVRLNETRQVLSKLSQKYWPGPMRIYLSVKDDVLNDGCTVLSSLLQSAPFHEDDGSDNQYLPLSCPSHPLLGRVLTEVHTQHDNQVVIGTPTTYISARNVCENHHDTDSETIHVLFGEDQRELFHVPTCCFGRDCGVSLWINADARLVYIIGNKKETMVQVSPESLEQAFLQMVNPKNVQQRVVCAVLRKWKIVDKRT